VFRRLNFERIFGALSRHSATGLSGRLFKLKRTVRRWRWSRAMPSDPPAKAELPLERILEPDQLDGCRGRDCARHDDDFILGGVQDLGRERSGVVGPPLLAGVTGRLLDDPQSAEGGGGLRPILLDRRGNPTLRPRGPGRLMGDASQCAQRWIEPIDKRHHGAQPIGERSFREAQGADGSLGRRERSGRLRQSDRYCSSKWV
jgi:hypothetical protein